MLCEHLLQSSMSQAEPTPNCEWDPTILTNYTICTRIFKFLQIFGLIMAYSGRNQ